MVLSPTGVDITCEVKRQPLPGPQQTPLTLLYSLGELLTAALWSMKRHRRTHTRNTLQHNNRGATQQQAAGQGVSHGSSSGFWSVQSLHTTQVQVEHERKVQTDSCKQLLLVVSQHATCHRSVHHDKRHVDSPPTTAGLQLSVCVSLCTFC